MIYIYIVNVIECIFVIFVNVTDRLYFCNIPDNTGTIDVFGTNNYFFSLENYLNFTCFKSRNVNILYVDLNIIDGSVFVKDLLMAHRHFQIKIKSNFYVHL